MSNVGYRLKKREKGRSEEETMRRFYEPIDTKKQRVLNKWLKAPRR